jgi:nucleotide-binding universal stress UspA family protein
MPAMKIKKILCPVDFSDQAYEALLAAADLAGDYSAKLLVAHVVESLPPLLGGGQDPVSQFQECCRLQEEDAKERLEKLVKRGLPDKIKIKTLIKNGHPAIQILEWAEEHEADLIVIATRGQSGWRPALLGSVTARIIKLTRRPVWVIQPKQSASSPIRKTPIKLKRILCPTDFSESADEALKAAADLAGDYSAELIVVHMLESRPSVPGSAPDLDSCFEKYGLEIKAAAEKHLDNLTEKMISTKVQVRSLVKKGPAAVQIVELAEKNQADLIVIATHGLTGWRQALLGSVTERVIKLTTKPMLIIQTKPLAGPIR